MQCLLLFGMHDFALSCVQPIPLEEKAGQEEVSEVDIRNNQVEDNREAKYSKEERCNGKK